MKVIVLGGGIIGVSSAWYLARAGHDVTVLERQSAVGLETSYANGGQISVGQSEPWANPHAPALIWKWLGREDAPLLFRPRADYAQWAWGARFMLECLPGRTRRNTLASLALASFSRDKLRELRSETGIEYDCLTKGILIFFTDRADYEKALPQVELMGRHGCKLEPKSDTECLAIEPALAAAKTPVVGGIYSPQDESGDAFKFTRQVAGLCSEAGVRFHYGFTVERIKAEGKRVVGLEVRHNDKRLVTLSADAYVLAFGSYSPLAAKGLGARLPVYPVKGYSVTIPLEAHHQAPSVCLTDASRKMAFSRLGNRLRVAGTAELNGYDTSINAVRCDALLQRAGELFPNGGERERAERWAGLRPATPGNVPIIGRGRHTNLYFNTGHGTLGWTMACGSGQAIADIVSGIKPAIEFPFRGVN